MFSECTNLKCVHLPESLEIIREKCFEISGLVEITIPKNVKIIEGFAFSGCKDLQKVAFEEGS